MTEGSFKDEQVYVAAKTRRQRLESSCLRVLRALRAPGFYGWWGDPVTFCPVERIEMRFRCALPSPERPTARGGGAARSPGTRRPPTTTRSGLCTPAPHLGPEPRPTLPSLCKVVRSFRGSTHWEGPCGEGGRRERRPFPRLQVVRSERQGLGFNWLLSVPAGPGEILASTGPAPGHTPHPTDGGARFTPTPSCVSGGHWRVCGEGRPGEEAPSDPQAGGAGASQAASASPAAAQPSC